MCVLQNKYLVVMGGLDSQNEEIYNEIWLFNTTKQSWSMVQQVQGDQINERESQSTTLIGEQIYIFAGQGNSMNELDIFYNDLFKMKIDIEGEKAVAQISQVVPKTVVLPSERASHSASAYRDRYLIVVGGEGYPSKEERIELEKKKELEKKSKKQSVHSDDDEQEKDQPAFPKSDVWVFDTQLEVWIEI